MGCKGSIQKNPTEFSVGNQIDWLMLEISFHGKAELFNENFLESRNVVLLVKQKHGLFVVNAVYRAERDGAIVVGDKDGVARNTGNAFVSIVKGLNIRK